ncbi:MAG: DNA polymerase IV [Bacteroidetes bacterium]|nr:DNA polymerase IV [Bacteroidota bacterium]MBS1628603.1 DNA polymerase IV [Bacteroidota bacterium]
MRYSANSIKPNPEAVVMYVDMNSFFASCEQQKNPMLRDRPIGVTAGDYAFACIIAPSIQAKRFGVKTGMRLHEARQLCPQLIGVQAQPVLYREVHIRLMEVLRNYCMEVIPKSIDEAAMNLTSYRLVYPDRKTLALRIKADFRRVLGPCITCSIGIAPNSFLAKLATDLQKPDGLVEITPENIDEHLAQLSLTDLPGIASRNARRLQLIGITTPLQLRHSSESLLRKAFGGVGGHYWHSRLHFGEVDLYTNDGYRSMSATRSIAPDNRRTEQLDALLVSLCTKLEQRLVTAHKFCRQAAFFIRYKNGTGWETAVRFNDAVQDGLEIRHYILQRMQAFEGGRQGILFHEGVRQMGVVLSDFVPEGMLQYSLFDTRMKQDLLRRVLYEIKGKWGKYSVRKATELVEQSKMKDAIGFGSVKDLNESGSLNHYLLEATDE